MKKSLSGKVHPLPLVLSAVLFSGVALGVRPGTWNHTTEADFAGGRFETTVVTSRGEITLGREIRIAMPSDSTPAVVSAVAVADKTIYVAAGNRSVIYRIDDKKVSEHAKLPGTMVTSLVWTGKELLAGTAGADAGIYRLDEKGQSHRLWADPQVQYVWAIVPGGDAALYAATGNEGKVFVIDKAGKAEAIYQAGELAKNILCLARSPEGLLYAGTDVNGLVVEINPAKKTSRIILDAAEKEVAALVLKPSGGVYAATSDVAKASPDGSVQPTSENVGKAEAPATAPAGGGKPLPGPASQPEGKGAAPALQPALPAAGAASKPAAPVKAPGTAPAGGVKAQAGPPVVIVRRVTAGPPQPQPPPQPPPPPAEAQGNAVYFIAPDGLVQTCFRRPVTILAMILSEGRLILGTGNGGKIYAVSTDGDEVAQWADTDAKQVTALAAGGDGSLVFGTSNKGSVGVFGRGFAPKGAFTSGALDAGQIAKWGTMQMSAATSQGSRVTVATRSGNVATPDDKTWSTWSNEQVVNGDFLPVTSPAGRFLQYRLTLSSAANAIPTVSQVQMIYQVGNLAPEVSGVAVAASAKGADQNVPEIGPKVYRHVMIRAADPNGDALAYTIEFRRADTQTWIRLAKNLPEPKYIWDSRTVADGVYELRVTASDSPTNPPPSALTGVRISESVVVDNTPPAIKDLAAKVEAGKVVVRGSATDATTRIVAIHYAVDGQQDWTAVLPTDGICDSQKENFSFEIDKLEPGSHLVVTRVTDLYENVGYATVTVTK